MIASENISDKAGEYLLEREMTLPVDRATVFRFFSDPSNLGRITPPELRFQILTPLPITMKDGAIIDYVIRLNGVPMKWRTRIEEWRPEERFVDTQLRGPYTLWHHTHAFRERVENGQVFTDMTDRVRYSPPLGIVGRLLHPWFIRPKLERIFNYRAQVIPKFFGLP